MKVYIGIDWSENKHDVCFLDEMGEVQLVQEIAHTIAGFWQLDQARQSLGVGRQEVILGLETAHNLLVDYLWEQGYEQIYVLPPAAVKSAQKRYRQSGAKDDRWDAHLIANLLRTDQRCYTPWKPDQPLTRQIPELDAAYAPLSQAQARILETLIRSRNACLTRLDQLFRLHPDHEIYDSLPKAGTLLAPALLAKLGDDRARYPTPAVLQAVVGTCPLTKRSGKHSYVLFRKACDRDFRHIVQQWARLTLDVSPWAATYYRTVRPHCQTDNDAIRRLANRWLEILWRVWVDRKPYDEALHLKQHTLRNRIDY